MNLHLASLQTAWRWLYIIPYGKKEALVMQFVMIIEKLPSSPAASKCSDTLTQSIPVGIHPHTLTADGLAAAGAGRHSWGRRDRRTFYTCQEERHQMGIFHVKLALHCVRVSYQSNCNYVRNIPTGVTTTFLLLSPITHVYTPVSSQENLFLMWS